MGSAASGGGGWALSEPEVLAHAKRSLFPDPDEPRTYAVCDTQFAQAEWGSAIPVADAVRELLAPFNHVRLGSGYPDLVGVRNLEPEWLAVDRVGEQPPLVAIEAKGVTDTGSVDTTRGIVQAYDRLADANAAYLAAPAAAIGQSDRALARELNVGVLAVDAEAGDVAGGAVTAVEVPRVVGGVASRDASAVRFQAGAQGVANQSFGLNHPKNYLGYALAHHAPGDTRDLVAEHVVGAVPAARRGAVFLGLVDDRPDADRLTSLGREVVRFARDREGSTEDALERFADWQASRQCFYDVAPGWGLLTRRVVFDYPATELLVDAVEELQETDPEPTLPDLVAYLHQTDPTFAVELFVRGTDDARRRVLTADGDLRQGPLGDGAVYHSPTVFQLKAMLYHAGLLTDRGAEPTRLEPHDDVWALRHPVRR